MTDQRIYIQLGRAGDILNILPLAWDDAQRGQRSAMMVAKQFANVLDGVSYVDRLIFDGPMSELDKAMMLAESKSKNVSVVQLVGPTDVVKSVVMRNGVEYKATTDSFLKDQWMLAGRLGDWKRQIPLVFDRRDKEREANLCHSVLPSGSKPCLFVSTSGTSSPFDYTALLLELLRLKFMRRFNVVDISSVKAERVYDLLGLFESDRAHCLIATDSAPLHLAYAVKHLPVVALVNDRPGYWHGSTYRPNHIAHIRYHDFPVRAVEMLEAICEIGGPFNYFSDELTTGRKVVHVWSEYDTRRSVAVMGTEDIGRWVECPIGPGAIGRDSVMQLKDDARYPFVKDVIRMATLRSNDTDVICLTKTDTVLPEGFSHTLLDAQGPVFSHRSYRDPLEYNPAIDLFAFTKQWWQQHQSEYPDMVLGRDGFWQITLCELLKAHGAKELPFTTYSQRKAAGPRVNTSKSPRIVHNEKLSTDFFTARNLTAIVPELEQQAAIAYIDRSSLFRFGYNPSIAPWGDKLAMVYRYHLKTRASLLAVAILTKDYRVESNLEVNIIGDESGQSAEDAKLFTYNGDLYCSFVRSEWPNKPQCSMRVGRLRLSENQWALSDITRPVVPNMKGMEKNWVFFSVAGERFFIYHNQPNQTVYRFDGQCAGERFESPTASWPWGAIHGGTPPIAFQGKLLRFFHTRMDNELSPSPFAHRYYVGACLMEPQPPFAILAVSKEPILRGCETDTLTGTERASCFHNKPKVVFPGTCILDGDTILLSVGVNDNACAIARLGVSDLKL